MKIIKKYIYKIENKINHKIYIGQSIQPYKRFLQHCRNKVQDNSLIDKAIQKYGKNHFKLEILGEFEDYYEKEQYYIQLYKSLAPYGYNIVPGGEEPPHFSGEEHSCASITQEQADKIIEQLKNWKIPLKTIIANNKITQNIARHIKEGTAWRKDTLLYPLRPNEKDIDVYRVKYIQFMCCNRLDVPLNKIGEMVGWNRSSAKMINQGKNHFDKQLKYPIRDNAEYNKQFLNQETCIDYLHFGE